jgi:hypothetical protein
MRQEHRYSNIVRRLVAGARNTSNEGGAMKRILITGMGVVLAAGISVAAIAADAQKSVTGSLEDSFCYNVVGAHGAGHAQCALKCAQKGIPVTLVQKGTEKMYILLPPKNEESLPQSVMSNMEKEVTVTGKEYSKGGVDFLTVESVK